MSRVRNTAPSSIGYAAPGDDPLTGLPVRPSRSTKLEATGRSVPGEELHAESYRRASGFRRADLCPLDRQVPECSNFKSGPRCFLFAVVLKIKKQFRFVFARTYLEELLATGDNTARSLRPLTLFCHGGSRESIRLSCGSVEADNDVSANQSFCKLLLLSPSRGAVFCLDSARPQRAGRGTVWVRNEPPWIVAKCCQWNSSQLLIGTSRSSLECPALMAG